MKDKSIFGDNFYPTPKNLITKMILKIKGNPSKILEPSAGKGDIIEALIDRYGNHRYSLNDISAIEINEELKATLLGKNIKVIDTDFLNYNGQDQYDLIIGNPPFEDGEKHLLKAIDIIYRGEIIFLINAETLRNPYTNIRKELAKRLDKLNAEIEYIKDSFINAERTTNVEVALIYINIQRNIEDDIYRDISEAPEQEDIRIKEKGELSTGKTIEELVAEYNQIICIGKETIINYYKNYKKIGKYIGLNQKAETDYIAEDMTLIMQNDLNDMLTKVRSDFWRRTIDIKEIRNKMTVNKRQEFEVKISQNCNMDFTENNIRQFIINLIKGHKKTLTEAILEIFDKFTIKHSFTGSQYEENIHLFNGWKTNKAFKVNKKVIIPIYGGYGDSAFLDWDGNWKLHYSVKEVLDDIDIVMNYFDGTGNYFSIYEALDSAFDRGKSRKIESTYFIITVYKKGTIHLEFKDENILRRFNVIACQGKNWLPHDYGTEKYDNYSVEEKNVVDTFEGKESYIKNINQPLFAKKSLPQIELKEKIIL